MSDDLERLLSESLDAIHRGNTRRPIVCRCGCGVTFINTVEYFRHQSRRNHPSSRRHG